MTATATATTTINHLFVQRAQEMPDTVALRRKVDGSWEDITWKGYYDAARKIGLPGGNPWHRRSAPSCTSSSFFRSRPSSVTRNSGQYSITGRTH